MTLIMIHKRDTEDVMHLVTTILSEEYNQKLFHIHLLEPET